MTGKQSADISPIKYVCELLLEKFGGCNFPSRNNLQLKVTFEVWQGVPLDTIYRIVPNFARKNRIGSEMNCAVFCNQVYRT